MLFLFNKRSVRSDDLARLFFLWPTQTVFERERRVTIRRHKHVCSINKSPDWQRTKLGHKKPTWQNQVKMLFSLLFFCVCLYFTAETKRTMTEKIDKTKHRARESRRDSERKKNAIESENGSEIKRKKRPAKTKFEHKWTNKQKGQPFLTGCVAG